MQPSANADVRITVPYLDRYLKFVFVFVYLYKYKYKYMVLYLDRYLYSSLYSDTVKSKCPKCKSTLFPLISMWVCCPKADLKAKAADVLKLKLKRINSMERLLSIMMHFKANCENDDFKFRTSPPGWWLSSEPWNCQCLSCFVKVAAHKNQNSLNKSLLLIKQLHTSQIEISTGKNGLRVVNYWSGLED